MNELSTIDKSSSYEDAKRGGIHDMIEIYVADMISSSIDNIDEYLKDGHKSVGGNEIIHIVHDSFQKILDKFKRNLEKMREVNFQ